MCYVWFDVLLWLKEETFCSHFDSGSKSVEKKSCKGDFCELESDEGYLEGMIEVVEEVSKSIFGRYAQVKIL